MTVATKGDLVLGNINIITHYDRDLHNNLRDCVAITEVTLRRDEETR